MNELFTLCGIGLCAVFAISVIREIHSEYVKWIVLGFIVLCIALIVPNVENVVSFIGNASAKSSMKYIGTIMKALGITYLTGTASQICHGVGEGTIGEHIETVGKIEILALSIPLFGELLEMSLL